MSALVFALPNDRAFERANDNAAFKRSPNQVLKCVFDGYIPENSAGIYVVADANDCVKDIIVGDKAIVAFETYDIILIGTGFMQVSQKLPAGFRIVEIYE